jgi:hypothetical protein
VNADAKDHRQPDVDKAIEQRRADRLRRRNTKVLEQDDHRHFDDAQALKDRRGQLKDGPYCISGQRDLETRVGAHRMERRPHAEHPEEIAHQPIRVRSGQRTRGNMSCRSRLPEFLHGRRKARFDSCGKLLAPQKDSDQEQRE